MKKIKYLLNKFDGIWSVPLTFLAFLLFGIALTEVFGFAAGTYDPGFVQPLFLAAMVVIGATNFGVLGLYFTFRGFHNFLYGKKDTEGVVINYSKRQWRKLEPWQQFVISLITLGYFITAIIIVYLKFV